MPTKKLQTCFIFKFYSHITAYICLQKWKSKAFINFTILAPKKPFLSDIFKILSRSIHFLPMSRGQGYDTSHWNVCEGSSSLVTQKGWYTFSLANKNLAINYSFLSYISLTRTRPAFSSLLFDKLAFTADQFSRVKYCFSKAECLEVLKRKSRHRSLGPFFFHLRGGFWFW